MERVYEDGDGRERRLSRGLLARLAGFAACPSNTNHVDGGHLVGSVWHSQEKWHLRFMFEGR